MKRLSKTDKSIIIKIVVALPFSPNDTPHARYKRARDKFFESLSKGSKRKYALYDACNAAASGIDKDRDLAIDAIKDCLE